MARAKLAEVIKEHREDQGREIDVANGKLTFGEAATLHMQQLEGDSEAKRRTKKYYRELLAALFKDWPALAQTEIRRIEHAKLKEWAARCAKLFSASRYNGTLSLLRAIFAVAVEGGVIFSNAAIGLPRRAQKAKRLKLPSRAQFAKFIAAIRNAKTRSAEHCADLTQGLAFTGCRISEAAKIEWRNLSFDIGEILVKGDPEEGTKNSETHNPKMPFCVVLQGFAKMPFTRMNTAEASLFGLRSFSWFAPQMTDDRRTATVERETVEPPA